MPSKLFIIAAPIALALLAQWHSRSKEKRRSWALSPPPSGINENFQGIPPELGSKYICLQGFGTTKCSSIRLAPDRKIAH